MTLQALSLVAAASQAFLVGVFLFASLSKMLKFGQFQETLVVLGVRPALTKSVAVGVATTEFVAAVGLAISPAVLWPRALVVMLAVAFALAGLKALVAKERIDCNCFGNVREALLGWRQIVLLPCWLLLAAMAHLRSPTWNPGRGLLGLTTFVLVLAYWQVLALAPGWRTLRGDRIALEEDRALVFGIGSRKRESVR